MTGEDGINSEHLSALSAYGIKPIPWSRREEEIFVLSKLIFVLNRADFSLLEKRRDSSEQLEPAPPDILSSDRRLLFLGRQYLLVDQ